MKMSNSPLRVTLLVLLAMSLALAGCATTSVPSIEARVLTGEAHSAEGAISIETGDWTYGVPLDGVQWTDANGSWHGGGRPECLPPSQETIPVTFAAVEVTMDGATWRPVVWVSCEA